MADHLIAVETYGSKRVTYKKERVSAQKLGYSGCARDVLLAVYGDRAKDVTSKRASYHYVQLDGDTTVQDGTILLRLNDEQLAQAEAITRQHRGLRSNIWRWFDNPGRTNNGWHSFPMADQPDYQPPRFREGPSYIPTGYRAVTPGVPGEVKSDKLIIIERSQLDPNKAPWWWISGDTYPHRPVFKANRCRWSKKRKSWYYIGETLPAQIQELDRRLCEQYGPGAGEEPEVDSPVAATEEKSREDEIDYDREYKVGERVVAVEDFVTANGVFVKKGTPGQVTVCHPAAGELGPSYSVTFAGEQETWCFGFRLKPVDYQPPTPTPPATPAAAPQAVTAPADAVTKSPRFEIGQKVYTNCRVKLDMNGSLIEQGAGGLVVRRYDISGGHRIKAFGYTVSFEGKVVPLFEDTLQSNPLPVNRGVVRNEPIMLSYDGNSLKNHIAKRERIVEGVDWDADNPDVPAADAVAADGFEFEVGQKVWAAHVISRLGQTSLSSSVPTGTEGVVVQRNNVWTGEEKAKRNYTVSFWSKGKCVLDASSLQTSPPDEQSDDDERQDLKDKMARLAEHLGRPVEPIRYPSGSGSTHPDPVKNPSQIDSESEPPTTASPAQQPPAEPVANPEPSTEGAVVATKAEQAAEPGQEEAGNDLVPSSEEDEEPSIRVKQFEPLSEELQRAVEAARDVSPQPAASSSQPPRSQATPIAQSYVGELTGAITGSVYCYGYAVHNDVLLYLNMGGPRTAVEAIRAKLAKGEVINLVPPDAPAVEIGPGETEGKANSGMYTAYINSISEAKFTSVILVHEHLTEPLYGGKSTTGIFRTSQQQAQAKLLDHVRKLVKVSVLDAWQAFLFSAGESAGLIRKPLGKGADLLLVDLDIDAWTRLITGGLVNGVIRIEKPEGEGAS